MKRLLIPGAAVAVALVVAVAIAIAATGGGGGGGTSSPRPETPSAGGATVSADQIGGAGSVLVNSDGQVTIDRGAPKGDSLPGKLGVVKRPDGDKQVTYNGKLLYTFYLDQPGKVGGDGFDDAFGGQQFTWHVVHDSGAASSQTSGDSGGSDFPSY